MKLIIDGHLDLAMNALNYGRDITRPVSEVNAAETHLKDDDCRGHAMVTLPEMRRGGVGICFSTLLAKSSPAPVDDPHGMRLTKRDVNYFSQDAAYAVARGQLAYYQRLHKRGEIRIITTRDNLHEHLQAWSDAVDDWQPGASGTDRLPVGMVLTMECADPIVEPEQAAYWHSLGLRMVMPAHAAMSHYAGGNASGGGLSERGRALVRAMARHRIALDISHLADDAIPEALELYDGPILASHSNCRALVSGARQLSDQSITAIVDRGGVIGIAIFNCFLKDGYHYHNSSRSEVTLDTIIDHIDHIRELAGGVDHIAIGSDFDGGYGNEATPVGMDTIADLQKLPEALTKRHYSDEEIAQILHGNWLRFLHRILP